MQNKITIGRIIKNIIILGIVGILIWGLYQILLLNYFNGFVKAVHQEGKTDFARDNVVTYGELNSYQITSHDFNDAMFARTVEVAPNTNYRVTCMVKTQDIITEKPVSTSGAQICIADTLEKSISIKGTNEWTKLEFLFNSKNRETIDLGFRLGGYEDNCKGTVWFSDFTLEMGSQNKDTNWKFATFIFQNIDINLENKNIKLEMDSNDINMVYDNMRRFKNACSEFSNYKMTAEYDVFEIKEPITSVSYDEENGYYVGVADIENSIKPYLEQKEYDHIFAIVRLGDDNKNIEIPVHDWIGLGGMDYVGIGFSNIRLPNDHNQYIYQYTKGINTFPEEVFLHEFLHSLERNLKEYHYEFPELHDYEKYGYENEKTVGLKKWYMDYMNKTIKDSQGEYVGLDGIVYSLKPVHVSDFKYTMSLKLGTERENIMDVIRNSIRLINNRIEIKKETGTVESFRI